MALSNAELIDTLGLTAFWDEASASIRRQLEDIQAGTGGLTYDDVMGIVGDALQSGEYLSSYPTTSLVQSMIDASMPNMANYRTASQIDKMIADAIPNTAEFRTYSQIQAMISASLPDMTPYRTAAQIQAMISASLPDLTAYRTQQQIQEMISSSLVDYRTYQQIQQIISASIAGFRTESQIHLLIDDELDDYRTYQQISQMISDAVATFLSSTAIRSLIAENAGGPSRYSVPIPTLKTSNYMINTSQMNGASSYYYYDFKAPAEYPIFLGLTGFSTAQSDRVYSSTNVTGTNIPSYSMWVTGTSTGGTASIRIYPGIATIRAFSTGVTVRYMQPTMGTAYFDLLWGSLSYTWSWVDF